jgi:NMD protein affecting ribosome stability and mRNA decay
MLLKTERQEKQRLAELETAVAHATCPTCGRSMEESLSLKKAKKRR